MPPPEFACTPRATTICSTHRGQSKSLRRDLELLRCAWEVSCFRIRSILRISYDTSQKRKQIPRMSEWWPMFWRNYLWKRSSKVHLSNSYTNGIIRFPSFQALWCSRSSLCCDKSLIIRSTTNDLETTDLGGRVATPSLHHIWSTTRRLTMWYKHEMHLKKWNEMRLTETQAAKRLMRLSVHQGGVKGRLQRGKGKERKGKEWGWVAERAEKGEEERRLLVGKPFGRIAAQAAHHFNCFNGITANP